MSDTSDSSRSAIRTIGRGTWTVTKFAGRKIRTTSRLVGIATMVGGAAALAVRILDQPRRPKRSYAGVGNDYDN
jgi:hypothetical protein